MSRAYLTIDDSPTKFTPGIVDYLGEKGIVPVINFIGENIEKHFKEAVYVAQKGIVIGNHSFTHPHFSELTLEECREEIKKTEAKINDVYKAAGVKRIHRVFRFPYGDKGGVNKGLIQRMLKEEFAFERLDDREIKYNWWSDNNLDKDIDMFWTFDFREYELNWGKGYSYNDIIERILDKNPKSGGALLEEDSMHIVLIHDIEETYEVLPNYFEKIIDYTLSKGVKYVKPKFIR